MVSLLILVPLANEGSRLLKPLGFSDEDGEDEMAGCCKRLWGAGIEPARMLARRISTTSQPQHPLRLCRKVTRPHRSMLPTSRPAISFFIDFITTSILVFTATSVWSEKETVASALMSALMPTSVCAPGQRTGWKVLYFRPAVSFGFARHNFALFRNHTQ